MKTYPDIVGDGGSNILGQVLEQRDRVRRKLAGVRRRIAVGSGKGGVGKSTLTRQIAATLSRKDRRIAILDADLNGPTQARLSGVEGQPLLPGSDGLQMPRSHDGIGVVSLGALVPESEAVDFESVSEGDSFVWRATREFTFLGQLMESVAWGELDLLLIDLPPGAERTFQYAEFLGAETGFVLVTLPSDLSRGVVSRSVAALRKTPNPLLGYVENMSGYYCEDCSSVKPLFAGTQEVDLGIPCLGQVPFDPRLAALGDRLDGGSLGDHRESARALREVAQKILEAVGEHP